MCRVRRLRARTIETKRKHIGLPVYMKGSDQPRDRLRERSNTSEKGAKTVSATHVPIIDTDKLNAFIGQFVTDLGAAVHSGMVVIGEKLGLYKALASGAMSSAELAARTQTDERYLREWLASQAAGGYITYDKNTNKFSLTE